MDPNVINDIVVKDIKFNGEKPSLNFTWNFRKTYFS